MTEQSQWSLQRVYRYEVRSGGRVIGSLTETGVDQPWFLCTFTPGPAWEEVSRVFAGMNQALAQQFAAEYRVAMAAYRDLQLLLHPVDGGDVIKPAIVWIDGGSARFRY